VIPVVAGNYWTDSGTHSFLWGNSFPEQSVVRLTKSCSSSSLSTGGGPTEDFKNLLVSRIRKLGLQIFQPLWCFFGYTSLPTPSTRIAGKAASISTELYTEISCYLNHRGCNFAHVDDERSREISPGITFVIANNCRNERSWHTSLIFITPCQLLLNFIKTTWELKGWFVVQ
jgi:hypothetical protein